MAGTSLIALIDDIASILDDVALLTKVAAKKTAGVLGDDLALNAQQVAGVHAERELPVVWAVAKGSLVNKAVLVPAALAISAVAAWAVTPLLMVGGGFLCFEGFEKLAHKLLHGDHEEQAKQAALLAALSDPAVDLVALERDKIKGAVRTDFVLSAEIVTIALGTVASSPFATRVAVLAGIGVLMTVGVYGLVAGIVKLDDLGFYLYERGRRDEAPQSARARWLRGSGRALVKASPYLMKTLSIAGTIAVFLVGGGILAHGIPGVHEQIEHLTAAVQELPGVGGALASALPSLLQGLFGVLAGALVLLGVSAGKRALRWTRRSEPT